MIKNPKPLHPGVVLNEVYMKEMGLRSISPEFAISLEKVLGTTAELWVRIQAEYDLWVARKKLAS